MTPEDNRLLTHVEGDAPMGRMLAQHCWFPALRAARLNAGGRPVRTRLLGRDLVAFRGHDGVVAVLDERCPHRGASLALARNEDNALRCIFHGWKMDGCAKLVDVPNEPNRPEHIKKAVKLPRYAAREAGGLVWIWVGGTGEPPPLPHFEFMDLPPEQVSVWFQPSQCNWFQALEGAIDSSHVGVLHEGQLKNFGAQIQHAKDDNAPKFEIEPKLYGYEAAAIRTLADRSQYVRVTQYVAPAASLIPPAGPEADRIAHFTVPVDDTHCLQLIVRFHAKRAPQTPPAFGEFRDPDAFAPLPGHGAQDCWGQDGASMDEGRSLTGFPTLFAEDLAVQESQGAIADRSREMMCTGDQVIARARRLMLNAVRAYVAGEPLPFEAPTNSAEPVRSRAGVVPLGENWRVSDAMQQEVLA
jgi:phthalate 4,5-dioxygenase oxygenase subunit